MNILNQQVYKKKYTFAELQQLLHRKKKIKNLKFSNQNWSTSESNFFQFKFLKTESSNLDVSHKKSLKMLRNISFNPNSLNHSNKQNFFESKNQIDNISNLSTINKNQLAKIQSRLKQTTINPKLTKEFQYFKQKTLQSPTQIKKTKIKNKSNLNLKKNFSSTNGQKKNSKNQRLISTISEEKNKPNLYQQLNSTLMTKQTTNLINSTMIKGIQQNQNKKNFIIDNQIMDIQNFFTEYNEEKEKIIQNLLIELKDYDKIHEIFKMMENQIIQYSNLENFPLFDSILQHKITTFMKGIYNKISTPSQALQKIIENTQFLQNLIITQNNQKKEKNNIKKKTHIFKNKFNLDILTLNRSDVNNNTVKVTKKSLNSIDVIPKIYSNIRSSMIRSSMIRNHSMLKQIPEIIMENQNSKRDSRRTTKRINQLNFNSNYFKYPEKNKSMIKTKKRYSNFLMQSKLTNKLNKDLHHQNLPNLIINQSFGLSLKRARIQKIRSYIRVNSPKICNTLPENLKNYEQHIQYTNKSIQQYQFDFLKQCKQENARDKLLIQDILNQLKKNEKEILVQTLEQKQNKQSQIETSDVQDYLPKFTIKVDKIQVIKGPAYNEQKIKRTESDDLIQKQMRNKVKFTDFIPSVISQKPKYNTIQDAKQIID